MNTEFVKGVNSVSLKNYYNSFFPIVLIWKLLREPKNRDIALSVTSKTGKNFVARNVMFANSNSFKTYLMNNTPYRIDIGAVFHVPLHKAFMSAINSQIGTDVVLPKYKEFVLDVDMEPPINWSSVAKTVRIIDHLLRREYGFSNFIFVFSGKKGIHCWILDQRAIELDEESRKLIADRLIFKGVDLDRDASFQIKHLLKLPFVIHPETGSVCLPFHAEEFDKYFPDGDDPQSDPMDVDQFLCFSHSIHQGGTGITINDLLSTNKKISSCAVAAFNRRVTLFSEWIKSSIPPQ